MSLEINSWTFSFQKTAFIDSNLIKLWLLEKNKITQKVYAFISLYNLFTSPFIILKEKTLELGIPRYLVLEKWVSSRRH